MSDHAKSNAAAWFEQLREMVTDLRLAESGGDCDAEETCRSRIEKSPLSVMIRDGWRMPGEKSEPHEYEILLSTGGPALRIVGRLGEYNEPETASLQWQDWGTPWTDAETSPTGEGDERDLIAFASVLYFGE